MSLPSRKPQARLAMLIKLAGFSVNPMVDPAGTGRDPRQILSGYTSWIAAIQTCLIIAMLVMAGGVMGWDRPAQAADPAPAAPAVNPGSPLTFEEAVKIALTQSPVFTKSSLDIEIQQALQFKFCYGTL
jgi:hypothetical protein